MSSSDACVAKMTDALKNMGVLGSSALVWPRDMTSNGGLWASTSRRNLVVTDKFLARGGLGETISFTHLANPEGSARDFLLDLDSDILVTYGFGLLGRVDLAPPVLAEIASVESSAASEFIVRCKNSRPLLSAAVDLDSPVDFRSAEYTIGSMGHLHFVGNSVNGGSLLASQLLAPKEALAVQLAHLHSVWLGWTGVHGGPLGVRTQLPRGRLLRLRLWLFGP